MLLAEQDWIQDSEMYFGITMIFLTFIFVIVVYSGRTIAIMHSKVDNMHSKVDNMHSKVDKILENQNAGADTDTSDSE